MLFYQEEKHILIFPVEIKYTLPVPVQHSQNAKTNLQFDKTAIDSPTPIHYPSLTTFSSQILGYSRI